MKEIIIVVVHMTDGGAERVLSELIDEWISSGYIITIIQLAADRYKEHYNLPANVNIINLKDRSKNKLIRRIGHVVDLAHILRHKKEAVVIAFLNRPIFLLGITSIFVNNKIIFSERNDPYNEPQSRWQRKIRDLLYYCADICVFQTKDAMAYFPSQIQKKGIVIPNPINPNLPDLYNGERRKAIIAIGRLCKQKNIPMMIDAFYILHKEYPEYTLEIYGRGEDEEGLQKYIHDLNMEKNILLCGFVQDIYSKLVDSYMYISSSNYEGISNAMLEAMALGIPTIVTDCPIGGARMIIEDGENGLLVPVGDSNALYHGMKKVIEDRFLANRLSANAFKIRKQYPLKKISNMWLDIIEQ